MAGATKKVLIKSTNNESIRISEYTNLCNFKIHLFVNSKQIRYSLIERSERIKMNKQVLKRQDLLYPELSYKIVGSAFDVYFVIKKFVYS